MATSIMSKLTLRRLVYEVSRFVVFVMWLPAYMLVVLRSLEAEFCRYSFLLCCAFTAWEIHYGVMAFGISNGTLYTRLFNVLYMAIDFAIAGCLIVYGNDETVDWSIPQRAGVYVLLVCLGLLLLHFFAHPSQPLYGEKRHYLIWLMVAAIPLFALVETFTLEADFVRWSTVGTVIGAGMVAKDFGSPVLNRIYQGSVLSGVAGILWAAWQFWENHDSAAV